MIYNSLLRPLLFQLDAERIHSLTHDFARYASRQSGLKRLAKTIYSYQSPKLSQEVMGLSFRNPIGLAAGFDKNGHIPGIMEAMGMGFVEIGSITRYSSEGNPKPRAFRLPRDRALINRMGLNNDGADLIVDRLNGNNYGIPVGINIAKTHNAEIMGDEAIADYKYSFDLAKEVADYITINISCPNTSAGKTFEDPETLIKLLTALNIHDESRTMPVVVKFSSDLDKPTLLQLLRICDDQGVNGYMACNTSSDRENLATAKKQLNKIGNGGLSGRPLVPKSVRMIRWISEATDGQKPIIGVGGIDCFDTALKMLRAGADLLQVYTGLIYEGPGLIKSINKSLVKYMDGRDISSLNELGKPKTS